MEGRSQFQGVSKSILSAFCSILLLSSCLPVANADWTGGIEGGTVIRDGSTATRLRLKASNNSRPLSQTLYLDWLRDSQGGNGYEAGYLPRYWLSKQLYSFAELRARVDKAIGIENQQWLLAGVGLQLIATPQHGLWGEAGAGKRRTDFVDDLQAEDTLGVIRAGYFQIVADILRLEIDVDGVSGESLTESGVEAGIAMRLAGGSIKLSYRIRRISPDVGDTVQESDSSVSFGYGF